MTRLMSRHVPIEMALLWLFELALSFAVIYVLTGPLGAAIPLAPMHAPNLAKLPHAALLAGILALSGISIGLYRTEICLDRRRVLLNAALAAVLAFPVALIVSGHLADGIERTYAVWLVKVLVLWFGFVLLSRSALRIAFKRRLFVRRLLVVGAAPAADGPPRRSPQEMPPETWQPRHGKMFDLVFPGADEAAALAPAALRQNRIWGVLVAGPDASAAIRPIGRDPLIDSKLNGTPVFTEATFWEQQLGRVNLDCLDRSWFLAADGFNAGRIGEAVKRGLDLVASIVLLVLTLPLMLMTALAIKLESPGPLLYRQERVGLHGTPFTVFKFRSMRNDAEAGGTPQWASKGDARVTRIGALIRPTRIDELPQLFNVLRGDMSLVGPRPERPHFVEQLAAAIPFYEQRSRVKPGITGWAQINYPYGASVEDAREKLSFDLYYLKNRGLFLDLFILLATVRVILFREGAR
jgi:exopolysaccharide biosynthesis polyprenyl glycosylphosphotransferase